MRYELIIEGMLAVHAKHAVFAALAGVEGLSRADVELGRAIVEFDVPRSDAAAVLTAAIEAAGFTVKSIRALPRALPML